MKDRKNIKLVDSKKSLVRNISLSRMSEIRGHSASREVDSHDKKNRNKGNPWERFKQALPDFGEYP